MVSHWMSVCLSIHQSYIHPSVVCWFVGILFLDDNLSKHQWICTKLGMRIDILGSWFGIANGKILSDFDGYLPKTRPYFVSEQ